ncbi:DUF1192 domain-containing protein [Propylenella binzhouense]|uniref:DUF1192 domain-containing protein n=1 Tax=Propylenella binzhouense TaxID=2555902 RepID=A0A964T582_9HYPH|nr:DUF1192 domain-containing protein [Propylenella binzhouense]MYZ48122.1 DUF1192 domain-containing protein [Propylenella binzhouense]
MGIFDEDSPPRRAAPSVGEDLSLLSIDEIEARIQLFRHEIERLQQAVAAKKKSRDAAHSVFNVSGKTS